MKNILIVLLVLLNGSISFAQENYLILEGKIGKYPVTMNLFKDSWSDDKENIVYTGYYYYHSQEIPIGFYQSSKIGSNLELITWDDVNNQNEIFQGTLDNGVYKGKWMHDKKLMDFELKAVPSSQYTELVYKENTRVIPISIPNSEEKIEGEFGYSFFLPTHPQLQKELMEKVFETKDDFETFTTKELNETEKLYKNEIASYLKEGYPVSASWSHSSFESLSPIINNQNYLVMTYNGYQYTGGAHGFSYEVFFTYDRRKQKWLNIEDVLNLAQSKQINQIIDKAVRKEFKLAPTGKLNEVEDTPFIAEEIGISENFSLSKKGITFHYGLYEVLPYSYGYYEVMIPYEDLKPYLNKNFAY